MARYIDADKLTKKIDEAQTSLESNVDRVWNRNKSFYKGLAWARGLVNEQPTADVEEVVRCKDCKSNPGIKTLTKGMVWCRKFRSEVHPDGFCSYGERKEK